MTPNLRISWSPSLETWSYGWGIQFKLRQEEHHDVEEHRVSQPEQAPPSVRTDARDGEIRLLPIYTCAAFILSSPSPPSRN